MLYFSAFVFHIFLSFFLNFSALCLPFLKQFFSLCNFALPSAIIGLSSICQNFTSRLMTVFLQNFPERRIKHNFGNLLTKNCVENVTKKNQKRLRRKWNIMWAICWVCNNTGRVEAEWLRFCAQRTSSMGNGCSLSVVMWFPRRKELVRYSINLETGVLSLTELSWCTATKHIKNWDYCKLT